MADESTIFTANVEVIAYTEHADKGIDGMKEKVKAVNPEVEKLGSNFEKTMHKIREQAGKHSELGELAELLKGAGAVAGISIVGEVLNSVIEKAAKVSEEFREGKTDASGLAAGIAESLPVIGSFVEAGQSIREMFTHDKETIAEITAELQASNAAMEMRVDLAKQSVKAEDDLTDAIRRAREAAAVAQAAPADKGAVAGGGKLADIHADQMRDQKEFADKRTEDAKKEIELIRKAGEERKKFAVEEAGKNALKGGYDFNEKREDYQIVEDAKTKAAADSDTATNKSVQQAQGRARGEIAQHGEGLDTESHEKRVAVVADLRKDSITSIIDTIKAKVAPAVEKALSPKDDKLAHDTTDAISKAKEEQLRITGHAFEAELEQLKHAHENQLSEVHRAAQEEVKAHPMNAKHIRAEETKAVGAENQSYQAATAAATDKNGEALRRLNLQYQEATASTFDEKMAANRASLEEQARAGTISANQIDGLNAAYGKLLSADIDNKLKGAAIALAEIGKTPLERQALEMERMKASAEEIAKFTKETAAAMTGNQIHDIMNELATVGKNPLDAAAIKANQNNEDGAAVGDATGKLLGAKLAETVKTPFETFQSTLAYYRELLDKNDISQQTFLRAQTKAMEQSGQLKTSTIEEHAMEHIKNQFSSIGAGVGQYRMKHVDQITDPNNPNNKPSGGGKGDQSDGSGNREKDSETKTLVTELSLTNYYVSRVLERLDKGIVGLAY